MYNCTIYNKNEKVKNYLIRYDIEDYHKIEFINHFD